MDITWAGILQLIGRLHPLAVHFPIGLLVVALFMEILTLNGKRPGLREGITWMVYIGTLGAVVSAMLGGLLQNFDDYSGELVKQHQYSGIATAILSSITALALYRTKRDKPLNLTVYRSTLFATVISLTITAHLGATLTHGEDYLSMSQAENNTLDNNTNVMHLLSQLNASETVTESQLDDLNLEVRQIIAHNCYQCHNQNKRKGDLVLDNKRDLFRGGESGPVIIEGNPGKSELYRRISLSKNHKEVMPKKGKTLQDNEISLIRLWIEKGAHWADRALNVFPEASLALSMPDLPQDSRENHPVDKLTNAYFEQHNVKWPDIVEDQTFIRRVYLDVIGLLPEPTQIAKFIDDPRPDKRVRLINDLLNDHHNYTQHWLSFWNDLLRNDYSGTGFITGGRKQITEWLYTSLKDNKAFDMMVKELVNPDAESEGFIKGIQWRGEVNSSQRTEMQAAQNIGQSLMGVNVKCASCHNSFVSNLTLEQSYGFAAIFADTKLELNRCDKPLGKIAKAEFLYPELGSVIGETKKERLALLSEILVKRENGKLYRTITNRIWQRLMGRGIIEPVDKMDNTPWDARLLDWLAADFMDSDYDLKHLIRMIMTSKTYQLPTVSYKRPSELKSELYVFKGPVIRRMSAEQFSDAVSQVIAPAFYAVSYSPGGEGLSNDRIWHREVKYLRDVLPEPGKRFFRHVFNLPDKEIRMAQVLISVDHSFILYVNGKQALEGRDWKKVGKLDVADLLRTGRNVIAIEGINEGTVANPAGILFAMKIIDDEGQENLLQSTTGWKSTKEEPGKGWERLEYQDEHWEDTRNYGSNHWDNLLNFTFEDSGSVFARASLVRQHPFLKVLGRPSRENVTTTRDDRATLLQALELTNGAYFNEILEDGAALWLDEFGNNSEEIAQALYLRSLGRNPSDQEREIMLAQLGDEPKKETLQDLFWATLNNPEFQFIY